MYLPLNTNFIFMHLSKLEKVKKILLKLKLCVFITVCVYSYIVVSFECVFGLTAVVQHNGLDYHHSVDTQM